MEILSFVLIFIILALVITLFIFFNKQILLLNELKLRGEVKGKEQDELREKLERTHQSLENLKTVYEERRKIEDESRGMVKRLERAILGSYSKGKAGENILRGIFKIFPREMMVNDFVVNGKVVEFGLVLPDKKILPIDSKWTSTEILIKLDEETDEKMRSLLVNQIEKAVSLRLKEVCQYIDSSVTTPWAIAAVPDAVFSVCKKAVWEGYKNQVLLMPYSMTVPYLLTFYSLYQNYTKRLDLANIQVRLIEIDRQLSEMEDILENRLTRGSTMISNACVDYKQLISRLRATVTYLQVVESEEHLGVGKEKDSV